MALDMHKRAINKNMQIDKKNIEEKELMKRIVTPEYPYDPLELIGERSFGEPKEVPIDEVGTPIQEFYRDATLFITGGTGFMGKVLIEKLLRSCPHIKHIYLLVRHKKGKKPHERIDEIFQDRKTILEYPIEKATCLKTCLYDILQDAGKIRPYETEITLFKRLKYEVPKYYHKLSTINGDLTAPSLGISNEDRKKLIEEVNVIFHGAATVRFDERIDIALKINVLGTREIVKLAKQVKNLKAIMYVSTAYSNCIRYEVEEKFYDIPDHYENIINKIHAVTNAEELERITPEIIGVWPNTYTFTKAVAESMVKTEAQGLPFAILRPAIIVSTYKEPVRGWIDNVYGPIGVIVGIGTGILHVYEANLERAMDMVPVDLVVNCLICAAEHTNKQHSNKLENEVKIYTYSSGTQNPITWGMFVSLSEKYGICWPTIRAVWYYSLIVTDNPYIFTTLNFFLHTIPGYIFDYLAVLLGEQPMLTKIYTKMDTAKNTLQYFARKEWMFRNENTQKLWKQLDDRDRELYFFDMSQFSWDTFCRTLCLGLRIYLVNDDIHTLPAARKKWNRLYYAHCTLRAAFYLLVIYLAWSLINLVFRFFN